MKNKWVLLIVLFGLFGFFVPPSFSAPAAKSKTKKASPRCSESLGSRGLRATQVDFFGGDLDEISPKSALGKYIEKTGATVIKRAFVKGPGSRTKGDKRWVVAVSANSLREFRKLAQDTRLLMHVHEPQQGTLITGQGGLVGSYGNHHSEIDVRQVGTLIPTILLSKKQAENAERFFDLAKASQEVALTPWILTNKEGDAYCAVGGYENCTMWFGQIPVGEDEVDSYTFPGKVDEHAYNSIHSDPERDAKPRRKNLQSFDRVKEDAFFELSASDLRLAKRVWTVPGRKMLYDVLDLKAEYLRGELANPGWVAYSLLGAASAEHVPVVFYFVDDHRAPIDPNFDLSIHAY